MPKTVRQMIPADVKYYSNREEYAQANGRQAPPFRPDLWQRLWTGPNKDGSYPAYKTLTPQGLMAAPAIPATPKSPMPLMDAFLGPSDGYGVNLAGHYRYMTWEQWLNTRASSSVTVTFQLFGGDRAQAVGKDALFTSSEASAVAAEMGHGATTQEATDWNGQKSTYNYPDGEKRRVWSIKLPNGTLLALSAVFRQRTEAANPGYGIGSPGEWLIDEAGTARFKGIPVNSGETRTDYVATPSVDLAPDEEVAMVAMGGMPVLVVRTKGEQPTAPAPSGGGGGLTAQEKSMLQDIYAASKLLVERTGG